ncbi:MAG: peptidase [Planctomycetaceae bacterium]|nr:peptidase [Planctomycetaceae bacterium]
MTQSSTRRRFLHSTTATATGTLLGSCFVRGSDKAGTKPLTVGSGEFVYECLHNWDRAGLPSDHHYGNASHGVAIDDAGLIYVTHQGNPGSIFVFESSGRFVRAMGQIHNPGAAKGHGIDIRREGGEEFIYLAPSDTSLAFTKMTLSGEVVWKKDRAAINQDTGGQLDAPKVGFRPTNTSFRPDGGYYLGDGYGSNYIFEYDRNDKYVRTLGGKGTADGRFSTPHGQWLDTRSGSTHLVVADRANKRLQWFDMDGNHARTMDGFLFPADIDVKDDLMLVPDLHARITILDKDNRVAAQLGDDEAWRAQVLDTSIGMRARPELWQPGKFVHPHDACFDSDGNIYVTEWVRTGRVTKLVRQV